MVSQLRLRSMAGASTHHGGIAPLRGRRTAAAPPEAASGTQDAMRAIQASLDALPRDDDPAPSAFGDEDSDGRRPVKRTRQSSSDQDDPTPPAIATSERRDGRTKIYVGGFEYTRATITSVKITYRCSYYRSQACPAKLEFYASVMDYDFANMVPHICTPPSRAPPTLDTGTRTLVVKAAMQREVDRLATSTAGTPQEIWATVSSQFYDRDDNVVVRGLSKAQVTKRVHRTRAMHFGSDLHGRVEVPPLSRVKLTPLNFFQFHHVWSNAALKTEYKIDRIIAWAHPSLLSLPRYGKVSLFVDGTFRCVPTHFRQCVVVMVYDQGSKLYVPVFYVLAASKTYDAYWNILQYVSDACGQRVDPAQVVCDFETALISAVCDWFPGTEIVGCFFHFKQACSRKMAKLRIAKGEIKVAMEQGVFDMLTVVEPSKIAKQGIAWVRAKIKERCGEEGVHYSESRWRKCWAYFRRTWLALLPPDFWNVYGIRRDVVARTNNPLERFNRELNAAFGTPHPSVVRFVQTIEEISRRYVKLREDIARGIVTPPRRDTRPELPHPVVLPDNDEENDDEDEDDDVEEDDDAEDENADANGSASSGEEDVSGGSDMENGVVVDHDVEAYEYESEDEAQV